MNGWECVFHSVIVVCATTVVALGMFFRHMTKLSKLENEIIKQEHSDV